MKKYLLWLNNGDDYEDQEITLLGVFSDKQKAKKAMKDADKSVKAALDEYMRKHPNAQVYYANVRVLKTNCTYRYTLEVETVEEDAVIS